MGVNYLYAEPKIDVDAWEKYSNNMFFSNDYAMTSFTHFSFVKSGKYFMINDL